VLLQRELRRGGVIAGNGGGVKAVDRIGLIGRPIPLPQEVSKAPAAV
jgi:hypothetical protein